MIVAAPRSNEEIAALAAQHWGQWEAGIRARDDIALGALQLLLESMARMHAPERPTERQLDVLQLLARGCTQEQAAERLQLGAETVKTHVKHAKAALGAATTTQAVAIAWRQCLID